MKDKTKRSHKRRPRGQGRRGGQSASEYSLQAALDRDRRALERYVPPNSDLVVGRDELGVKWVPASGTASHSERLTTTPRSFGMSPQQPRNALCSTRRPSGTVRAS